ncbi:hypothetical protein BDV96DRAFT_576706 [Lophiotrema nucula]|uniref:Clr5 domain-containing protein n=1 Tax=Lophiotrema nucula TaxID=690887 RepID=A0A6A5Z4Q7_9PLEO|nr:hypothetical protein BDV96DRAFT_576706 [Lophiotrema nucula]
MSPSTQPRNVPPKPTKEHPPDVWEGHRVPFKRLYVDEGKTLQQVREMMENKYGFCATYVN